MRTLLAFCLPGIGDSLLGTPAFRAIKLAWPDVRITALTMFTGAADVLRQCRFVDEVVNWDFIRESTWRSLRFVLSLRARHFDVSILMYPANRLEYNLMAWLIGAQKRLGHRYSHYDLVCGNWLNNMAVREDDTLTNVEENLRLAELLTGCEREDMSPAFVLEPQHHAYADCWLEEHGISDRLLIGFHPGGSTNKNHVHKRWPPEHFVELGRMLIRRLRATVLLFGGPQEDHLKEEISLGIGSDAVAVSVPGVLESCALMRRCAHFVSNDSALLHLATAMGVRTTGIFGPTNPVWVRIPGAMRAEAALGLPCQPCFFYSPQHVQCEFGDFRCLRQLSPETVAEMVLRQLDSHLDVEPQDFADRNGE